MIFSIFQNLDLSSKKSNSIANKCLNLALLSTDLTDYEQSAHSVLKNEGITETIPKKLAERARIIYGQISPHLIAGSVLDLGCGDARLAQLLIQDGFNLQLADVYKNPNVNAKTPFKLLEQNKSLPFSEDQFDNTLLLTVLHHSDNPLQLVSEARRVTRDNGIIAIVESVYGVNGQALSVEQRDEIKNYLTLTHKQQFKVNIFFDHFYNRIIHYTNDQTKKVNIPFNFNSPEIWERHFEQIGSRQEKLIHLGIDQPTVPEYHTLHILKVIKNGLDPQTKR